jgi:hypothetical protein
MTTIDDRDQSVPWTEQDKKKLRHCLADLIRNQAVKNAMSFRPSLRSNIPLDNDITRVIHELSRVRSDLLTWADADRIVVTLINKDKRFQLGVEAKSPAEAEQIMATLNGWGIECEIFAAGGKDAIIMQR